MFAKAAALGDDVAQFSLGVHYENDQAVAQDYKAAAAWYTEAAEQSLKKSPVYPCPPLRKWLWRRRVAQDAAAAAAWYTMAAVQGSAEAKLRLGALYILGRGVAQDFNAASV